MLRKDLTEILKSESINYNVHSNPMENLLKFEETKLFCDKNSAINNFAREYNRIIFKQTNNNKYDFQIKKIDLNISDFIVVDSKLDNRAYLIATVNNSSYILQKYYIDNSGYFYDASGNTISDCFEGFLDYLIKVNYEYHPSISDYTYNLLKEAGWYPGRKVDISDIVYFCEQSHISLSQKQQDIISEFRGIESNYNNNLYFCIFDEIEDIHFTQPIININEFGKDLINIGIGLGMLYMYLTTDGLLVLENGRQCGLNIMEGFDVLFRICK